MVQTVPVPDHPCPFALSVAHFSHRCPRASRHKNQLPSDIPSFSLPNVTPATEGTTSWLRSRLQVGNSLDVDLNNIPDNHARNHLGRISPAGSACCFEILEFSSCAACIAEDVLADDVEARRPARLTKAHGGN